MYIGIDLGTTNSAITSFDGKNTRVWKSPEQNDVTPSVIYVNKRGGRMYGQSAYNNELRDPGNTAKLFKRLMGSSTKITLDCGLELTPEECSSEILRTLFGYLPEEVRNDPKTGTVITIPAAFNQMQRDATKQAAFNAGINRVALIQEPVAAIETVAEQSDISGQFVVYDLGGGTFDVTIAERFGSNINLLTTGGIQYCGGRDLDKLIFDSVVVPWIRENFSVPDNVDSDARYATLMRMAMWATEKAKIELSSRDSSTVRLDEGEARCTDEAGNEIYLDVPLTRERYESLIFPKIRETIDKTREIIAGAGLRPEDISRIVFIGGPTMYKPLRDLVSYELGIEANIDVNPMTAVSEGAAIYAESVDFENGRQTATVGTVTSRSYGLKFRYDARTSRDKAKIAVMFEGAAKMDFVFRCVDTGWTSGRMTLGSSEIVSVDLNNMGENTFAVQCFGPDGAEVRLDEPRIVITKTPTNIGRIPCAHSVGVEIENPTTHKPELDYLIRKDESLPKSGTVTYKTTKRIAARSSDAISFKLWEGEIEQPVEYNRLIGDIKIDGNSFDSGLIPVGAAIECAYSFSDSGNISISITVPSVAIKLTSDDFYDPTSGKIDYENDADKIISDAQAVLDRAEDFNENRFDARLDEVVRGIREAMSKDDMDAEDLQNLSEVTQKGKGVVASFMRDNQRDVWESRLNDLMNDYGVFKGDASATEDRQIRNLEENARRAIEADNPTAEVLIKQLGEAVTGVMMKNDSFFISLFYSMAQSPESFSDRARYRQLVAAGESYLSRSDMNGFRKTVVELVGIMTRPSSDIEDIIKNSGITK